MRNISVTHLLHLTTLLPSDKGEGTHRVQLQDWTMHLFFIFVKRILITRWKILWNHKAKHGLV